VISITAIYQECSRFNAEYSGNTTTVYTSRKRAADIVLLEEYQVAKIHGALLMLLSLVRLRKLLVALFNILRSFCTYSSSHAMF